MNTTHDYTDEQLQAAIDAAFPAGARPEGFNLDNRPSSVDWKLEAPNRLAIARRLVEILAALPKSWTLPAPPPGRRWHREDWTADMLPEEYRPLLNGEVIEVGDEYCPCGFGPWKPVALDGWAYCVGVRVNSRAVRFRTRRPLPAEASAEPEQVKPAPGHGHQDAQYHMPKLPNPLVQPATFEAHGKVWTRHMPGDPCPCDLRASVYVAFKDGTFSGRPGLAVNWAWGTYLPDSEWLIGWRYADEPAQAEAANTDKEWNEYQQELMNPLPKPWTPRPGDVVRLKSGGPVMTVEAPNKDSNTFCSWFDGNGINQRFFPAACLTPVKKLQS